MTQSSTIDILKAGGGEAGAGDAIERAARRIRCDKAVLQAILEVESGADAYDDKGRLIILPEKHVFHRELPKGLRAKALKLGLAARKWTRANYKGLGGKGSDKRWDLLGRMVDCHETAGLRSASYGGPQIMGFNHKICGYDSVAEFVLAMAETEEAQIEAFVRFLEGVGLSADLRERDFRAIARRYNGSGQVAKYAGMMERAYRRIAGKAAKAGAPKRGRNLRLGSEGRRVKALQERLVELGYHVVIDGDYGPATRRAVVQFQADRGLKADGIVGPKTSDGLDDAVAIPDQLGGSRAADFVDKMKQTDLKHFDEESGFGTAGKIFEHFAGKHGISAAVSSGIANVPVPYRLQHNESDIGFITELADDLGAIVKPQNGRLVIRERGKSESASGKTLQTLIINKADVGEGYEIEIEPRTAYSKVEAPWFDNKAGKPDRDEKDLGRAATRLLLPRPYPSKAEAEKAAGAAAQAQNRAAASGSFEMAGQPGAFAGKTSIGARIFGPDRVYAGGSWPSDKPIIDAIAPDGDFDAVTAALSSVGLGSVPAWLRPYQVLSNGERFRADLARIVCDRPAEIVIDEFSSVVDRQIAKVGAMAFGKAWRRTGGRAVLLSCHYDIAEWLQPDWVYDTGTGQFTGRYLRRRPEIALDIFRTNWRYWPLFEPHHYLKMPKMIAATNYVGFVAGEPVAHAAFSTRPGLVEARACRLVIMPEWQGAGVGMRFLNAICAQWRRGQNRYDKPMPTLFHTSHPGLAAALRRDPLWVQVSVMLCGDNKARSRASIKRSHDRNPPQGKQPKSGYGGHFRAVQGFRYAE